MKFFWLGPVPDKGVYVIEVVVVVEVVNWRLPSDMKILFLSGWIELSRVVNHPSLLSIKRREVERMTWAHTDCHTFTLPKRNVIAATCYFTITGGRLNEEKKVAFGF